MQRSAAWIPLCVLFASMALSTIAWTAEEKPDSATTLLAEIIPENGPVRPPYEFARYDMGLEPKEKINELNAAALERQDSFEARYVSLKEARENRGPDNEWSILAYAFGEAPMDQALNSARALGDDARLRFARLLIAECRFGTAIQELFALADGNGEKSLPALTQLVILDRYHSALDEHLALVPFEADVKAYLKKRAQDPETARFIEGLRNGAMPPLSIAANRNKPIQEPIDEVERVIEADSFDDLRIANAQDLHLDTLHSWDHTLHTATELLGPSYVFESLNKRYLETFSTRLVLYRERKNDDIVITPDASLKLHTDCGGPIDFKLYRFTDRQPWENLDARTFSGLKPCQSWEAAFRPLRDNNRGTANEYDVNSKDLEEGYYLMTAEARYLPVIASQKFLVSHVALYLRTAPNQAIVAAVDRRSGAPVPQLPLNLTIQGRPGLRCTGSDFDARPASFRAGFDNQAAPTDHDPTLAPADYEKSMREYQAGLALRARYPDVKLDLEKNTDASGIATFPLHLEKGYDFTLQATRQTVGFAEATVQFNMPAEPTDQTKTVVWTAQPLYRPGDLVHFKGVVRRFNGLRVAPHTVDWKQQVKVVVKNEKEQLWEGPCELTNAGCFSGEFTIPATASLGTYDLLVDATTAQPPAVLKVEHFRVPTFKVSVRLADHMQQGGKLITGAATVRYAFGKPVANAEVEIALECGTDQPATQVLFTDAQGQAAFQLPLPTVPKDIKAMVRATALDASGESYSDFSSLTITPVAFSLSIMDGPRERYVNGQQATIQIQANDWSGQPLPGITIALVGSRTTELTDANGRAKMSFTTPDAGSRQTLQFMAIRGREAVHLEHTIWLEKPAPPTTPGVAVDPKPVPRDFLNIETPWTCNAGDPAKVKLTVERSTGGKAFVLLFAENTRALFHRALYVDPGEHAIELPTDLDCAPTFELDAVLLTGTDYRNTERTIRVKPVQRFLDLQILTDKEEYKPGETCRAEIVVCDWQKHPVGGAEISLGVVNEALYDLKGDPTPDLQHFFYDYHLPQYSSYRFDASAPVFPAAIWIKGPKLGWGYWVRGDDGFGHRTGGGRRRLVSRGGGSRATESVRTRLNFRTEAHWVADLVTDAAGRARVQFAFPDDITFWRFTARAVSPDTMVGQIRSRHRTFLPTQVEWSLPRALRAGDRIAAAALVHNNVDQPREFTLAFAGDAGDGKIEMSVPEQGSGRAEVSLTPEQPSPLKLKATVQVAGGNEGDAMERELPVLPGGYPVSKIIHGTLREEATIPLGFDLTSQPDHLELTLCVEPGVVGPIVSAIDQLIGYPYGCVEQTMSRFLPAVIAGRAMKRVKQPFTKEKELPEILEKGLARLAGYQHQDGGWGWWQHDQTNDFMTAYVLEGLTLCREAGHPVPAGMLDRAAECAFQHLIQKRLAADHKVYSIGEASPAIYVAHALALFYASEPERFVTQRDRLKALLPDVEKELPFPRDRVLQADVYRLLGMNARAGELLDALAGSIRPVPGDRASILATATFLEASQAIAPDRAGNLNLARHLIGLRRGSRWMDTQATAAVVRGLCTLITGEQVEPVPVDVLVDGKIISRLEPKTNQSTRLVLKSELLKAQSVTLRPVGNAPADSFWSARLSGYAPEAPPNPADATAQVTCMVYKTGVQEEEILPDAEGRLSVQRGQTLRIRLRCQTRQPLDFLRVSLPRPCGVELVRPPRPAVNGKQNGFVSFEEHDDGFHFFIDRCEKQTEIDFLVRAQVSGQVFSPPPEMEPMYGDAVPVQTTGPRQWVISEPPK